MPETPKKKPAREEAECGEPDDKRDLWESDQAERSYYYDDSHGYEVFDPETDDEPEASGLVNDVVGTSEA